LRLVPELEFCVDDSFDQAGRIDRLLREARATGPGRDALTDEPGDDHGA
jgi:hypothetical protein